MSLQQFTSDLHNTALNDVAKHQSFKSFITYFDGLQNPLMATRTYSDTQLAQHIFKHSYPKKQEQLVLEKHFIAAKNTLHRVDQFVNATNFNQYEFLIRTIAFDLFPIVKHVEVVVLGNTLNWNIGVRPDQSAWEIYDIARLMLHIGAVNPVNLYQREIFPVAVFLLRQTIEVYGKKAVGFYSITLPDGQRPRGVSTQVAWEFIKHDKLNLSDRITLPTDLNTILAIETWSNHYVHTGGIPESYLIENALHLLKPLVRRGNRTPNYRGMVGGFYTAEIRDYNAIRQDFEKFVNTSQALSCWDRVKTFFGLKKKQAKRVVNWMNIDSVEATITSL